MATVMELEAELSQLLDDKEANGLDLMNIKAQLDAARAAKARGEAMDSHWYFRATAAARYKGGEDQRLARQIGEVKRALRLAKHEVTMTGHDGFAWAFFEAAKHRLTGSMFDDLCEAARARVAGHGQG